MTLYWKVLCFWILFITGALHSLFSGSCVSFSALPVFDEQLKLRGRVCSVRAPVHISQWAPVLWIHIHQKVSFALLWVMSGVLLNLDTDLDEWRSLMLPDYRWRKLHGQGTQDGCCLALCTSPAQPVLLHLYLAHMTGLSTLLFPALHPVIILSKGAGGGGVPLCFPGDWWAHLTSGSLLLVISFHLGVKTTPMSCLPSAHSGMSLQDLVSDV